MALRPGIVRQVLGGFAKWLEPEAHLLFDRGDGLVQGIDVAEVELEHEAVMRADAPAQRFQQLAAAGFSPAC